MLLYLCKTNTFSLYSYPKPEKLDVYKGDNYFEPNESEIPDLSTGNFIFYPNNIKQFT